MLGKTSTSGRPRPSLLFPPLLQHATLESTPFLPDHEGDKLSCDASTDILYIRCNQAFGGSIQSPQRLSSLEVSQTTAYGYLKHPQRSDEWLFLGCMKHDKHLQCAENRIFHLIFTNSEASILAEPEFMASPQVIFTQLHKTYKDFFWTRDARRERAFLREIGSAAALPG